MMSKIDNIVKSGGFDFHCHSTVSGGKYTVREICDMAVERNFSMLSITDHNSIVSNVNEIKRIYKKQGLDVIIGSELTGIYGGAEKMKKYILLH